MAAYPAGQTGSPTETLDRVIATASGVPFTQSDLIHEYRLESFLAGGRIPADPPDPAAQTSALARLINQKLMQGELGGYRFNDGAINLRARRRMAMLKNKFKNEEDFQAALRALGMNESQLMNRIEDQEKILEMIDMRLRPAATVDAKDIESYYHKTLLPGFAREGKGPTPSLAQTQGKIREILIQKKINQLLDEWLIELRRERQVEILGN